MERRNYIMKNNQISQETKIKASFTFVILKLLEFGSLFGIIFGLPLLGKWAVENKIISGFGTNIWMNGIITLIYFFFIVLLIVFLGTILFFGGKWFVMLNWRWSLMLHETPEEKLIREKKEAEKRLKKLEKRKDAFIEEHGFWIGDKIKLVRPNTEKEKQLSNKILKLKGISLFGNAVIEGHEDVWSLFFSQLEPVEDRRKK
jgi:hypothetical protein